MAKVSLEEGALLRYVYDRWDEEEWGEFKTTREASGETITIESRYLLVTPDLEVVEDVVETWNDHRAPAPTGAISGVVVDAATGKPLMDTNVSIAGLHTATHYDGSFEIDSIAAGPQRITVFRTLGDYHPASTVVEVPEGGSAEVEIAMEAAQPVEVTFRVALPEDTPPDAEIRLNGSVYQAGALPARHTNYPFMPDINAPVLKRVAPNLAEGKLQLHEGTYLQYFYSMGPIREKTEDGGYVCRSRLVGSSPETYYDGVVSWRQPGQVRLTLRVTVPPNTPPGVPVASGGWMTQVGPHQWVTFVQDWPGVELGYDYRLGGDDTLGADGSEGLGPEGRRTLVFPEGDSVLEERVERWLWNRPAVIPEDGEPFEVTFRVSVPASTPSDARIRLVGNVPELESGITMAQQADNPWIYQATVSFAQAGPINYQYDRGEPGTETPRIYSTRIEYSGQVIDDWVTVWGDSPQDSGGTRPDFITGIYPPDYWTPTFLPLLASTFQRIKNHNADWVAISSVWSYGQTTPVPVIEPRPIKAGAVLVLREDILAQAEIAHEAGLNIMLAPQFNMEMSPPGSEPVCGSHSKSWWDGWLKEAERFWMWHAIVAEEINAEALLLPGPCFHVFTGIRVGSGDPYLAEFDRRVAELIAKVRQVYSGKLIMNGFNIDYQFLNLVDLIGVTAYDIGHPALSYNAGVEQWRKAYDALFRRTIDPIYKRWGKPVLFYQLHFPPHPADPDPTGESLQARRSEGFFQALESRPWVSGTFSWAYPMIDAPLLNDDFVRARLAEAVLAKYYGIYTGR